MPNYTTTEHLKLFLKVEYEKKRMRKAFFLLLSGFNRFSSCVNYTLKVENGQKQMIIQ